MPTKLPSKSIRSPPIPDLVILHVDIIYFSVRSSVTVPAVAINLPELKPRPTAKEQHYNPNHSALNALCLLSYLEGALVSSVSEEGRWDHEEI